MKQTADMYFNEIMHHMILFIIGIFRYVKMG